MIKNNDFSNLVFGRKSSKVFDKEYDIIRKNHNTYVK